MPNGWLKAPHYRQTADGTCLQACARMVLAYWQHFVSESELSILFAATEIGVPASRIQRLSQWGYVVDYRTVPLETLRNCLSQQVPPIVFVQTEFLEYWRTATPHAVVLVGMDATNVYLSDPSFATAPQTASLDGFLTAWVEMDETAAIIRPAS